MDEALVEKVANAISQVRWDEDGDFNRPWAIAAASAAIAAMPGWRPIASAPTDRQFLATDWTPEDTWGSASIEVLSGPHKFVSEPRLRFLNHNSGNYSDVRHWTYWCEKPGAPLPEGASVGDEKHEAGHAVP